MASVSTITIEVQDGATPAFKQLNAEAAKLGPTLQPIQRVSEQTFNNIEHGALKARESAALLGEEFGVKIPRALRGTIAEASLIGPIFTSAFSGLAIIGFIQIAIEAGKKIGELVEHLWGHEEQAKKTREAQAELNKIIAEGAVKVGELQEAYRLIGLEGLPRISAQQVIANEKFEAGKKSVGDLTARLQILRDEYAKNRAQVTYPWGIEKLATGPTEAVEALKGAKDKIAELDKELAQAKVNLTGLGQAAQNVGKDFAITFQKDRAEEIKKIAMATAEAGVKLLEMSSAAAKGGLTGIAQINAEAQAQLDAVAKIFSTEPTLAAEAAHAVTAIRAEQFRKTIAFYEAEIEKKTKLDEQFDAEEQRLEHERAERLRRMEDESINVERQAAIAIAPPWARANATILADYQARMDKIKEMLATGDLDSEHAARQSAAAWTDAFAKMRDKLATDMETLFDNITSGNIGKYFLTQFKHLVFQMLSTWILGMQGMKAASQQQMGSGGGILGSIFGGIFGGGGGGITGGVGPGGTPPIFGGLLGPGGNGDFGGEVTGGSSGGGILGMLGLSAGGGAGSNPLIDTGAGPGSAQAGGPIAGLLGKLFGRSLGPISGSVIGMAGIGLGIDGLQRGSWLGALESAAGGAMIGFEVGGPLGALVGGIIGGIAGIVSAIFGGKKRTRQANALTAQLEIDIKNVVDSYNLFQTDYNGTISNLETLRSQYTAQLNKLGADVNARVTPRVNAAEDQVKATQAERNRRAGLAFGPAEFRTGGFVGSGNGGAIPSWFAGTAMHFSGGGAVPAILHEGEFVMRPEAVGRIGVGTLSRMNSGGAGEVHNHFYISAIDAKSFLQFLDSGGMDKIELSRRRGVANGRYD
jgi:gas vesicle protein